MIIDRRTTAADTELVSRIALSRGSPPIGCEHTSHASQRQDARKVKVPSCPSPSPSFLHQTKRPPIKQPDGRCGAVSHATDLLETAPLQVPGSNPTTNLADRTHAQERAEGNLRIARLHLAQSLAPCSSDAFASCRSSPGCLSSPTCLRETSQLVEGAQDRTNRAKDEKRQLFVVPVCRASIAGGK